MTFSAELQEDLRNRLTDLLVHAFDEDGSTVDSHYSEAHEDLLDLFNCTRLFDEAVRRHKQIRAARTMAKAAEDAVAIGLGQSPSTPLAAE